MKRSMKEIGRGAAAVSKKKEEVYRKLGVVAEKLVITAKEKEEVRKKLIVTAKEKESVRRDLAASAKKLKIAYETLEAKVRERTKSLEMAAAKEKAILLSIGDGLIVTDENGVITIVNETAGEMFRGNGELIPGRGFDEAVPLENEKGALVPSSATKSAPMGLSYYYARKEAGRFPVSMMATPVLLSGKVIGAIRIFRDITYEREVDRAKTEFVSLASHQLRTPLSTVNWYTEMLLAGDAGELNGKQRKYLDEVYTSNQRMVELVNALLDVSSLELGTFVIDPQTVDVKKLAESVITEQMPQMSFKGMVFSFSCAEDVSFMRADPKLVRMVMQNILSNAIKYTPQGGKISMILSRANRKDILLRVTDTGYGIPENQKDKICKKFFRADNVRNKDTDGTGLGLYIVKSVIENAGGKMWFTSSTKAGESGTIFYAILPIGESA